MTDAQKSEVLFLVEDPGAVNFVALLPEALLKLGLSSKILAGGLAIQQLDRLGVPYSEIESLEAREVFVRYQPELLIFGTSENRDSLLFKLVLEARSKRVPTIGIVDMNVNTERRFNGRSDNPLQYAPDYIFVPDQQTRSSYEKLSFPPQSVLVCGYPQFDYIQSLREKLLIESPIESRMANRQDKSTIVFVAEPASVANPQLTRRNKNYRFTGTRQSAFRTWIALEELLNGIQHVGMNAELILRLHPKNSEEEFESYREHVSSISAKESPFELLWKADLVVGMTSMLLQEAAWLGKKVLSILCEPEEYDRLPAIQCGLIKSVLSRDELMLALNQFKTGSWENKDPGAFFERDAVQTMVKFMAKIIRGKPA